MISENTSIDTRKNKSQDWKRFFDKSSFSYLSGTKGQWKDGNGKIHNIDNMDDNHKDNCIKIVERDIAFVKEGEFERQLDVKMIKNMFDIDGRRNVEKYFGVDIATIKSNMVRVAIVALKDKKDELEM